MEQASTCSRWEMERRPAFVQAEPRPAHGAQQEIDAGGLEVRIGGMELDAVPPAEIGRAHV